MDAVWRYSADGTTPPSEWTSAGFNDSAWPTGAALLGFEELSVYPEPLRTELNIKAPGSDTNILSYFFRIPFQFPTNPAGVRLIAGALLDDGAIFHVNGVIAGRLNIPAGAVIATNQQYEGCYQVVELSGNALTEGENLLAVEVRQGAANSSDVVFGMKLVAVWPDPISITDGPMVEGQILGQLSTFSVHVAGTEPKFQWLKDGTPIAGATNATYVISQTQTSHAGAYSVTVSNSLGTAASVEIPFNPISDTLPPVLLKAILSTNLANALDLTFSERLAQASARNLANYSLTRDGSVTAVTNVLQSANLVRLFAAAPISSDHVYTVTVRDLQDLSNNQMTAAQTADVAFFFPFSCVPLEARWRFQYEPLYGDLSHEWTRTDYDDSGWFGPYTAPLANSNANHELPGLGVLPVARTVYFRTTFVYPGSSVGWVRLGIREWVDDAANFYLNGQEVAHFVGNSYNDFASGAGPNFSPTAPFDRAAAEGLALIKPGTNVFAAELHQASADTSFASPGFPTSRPDMLFAAALEAFIQYGRRVPPIDYTREGNELVLTWVDGDSELQAADAITGPWQTIVTSGQVYREPVIETSRFFRLREREQ